MEFVNTFWALVPPIVAIVLALITKETYSSLFIGILVGALFVSGFSPVGTLDAMITEGFTPAISDNAGIFMFLVILGIMVALVNSTGAAAAFGKWAARHVKTRAGTLFATFVLGVLIFIDDYFNCLTVGSVMRPLTDNQKVSRAKLAYIIDATAAPVCMIAPVSSWAAAVSGVAEKLDSGISGIQLFIQAIPFNFYSLLTFVFVIGMIVMGFDYGPMAKSELEALKGNLGSLGNDEEVESTKATLWDMLIPIIALIIMCIIGLMYVLICRGVTSFKDAMSCAVKGFNAMVPAILILTFAVSLKNMTGLLGAATYVEGVMKAASAGLFSMLPAIIFIVACLLAFATGTSWGTFGILIPIVLPIFKVGDPLLMIGISACLAGAVCGDHCSPISDTTIMASAGANCNHIEHVQTQLPYAVTVALISFVNFIIAGFVKNAWICLPIGIVMTIVVLFILRATVGKRTSVAAEK
ncbi:MAG: Na+/H+ antiporter NhaC family protein [Firmicutes bacterium]|nr:Na+/H+ antiporter NhaC family protein [Bacillota bacterium]